MALAYVEVESLQSLKPCQEGPDLRFCLCLEQRLNSRSVAGSDLQPGWTQRSKRPKRLKRPNPGQGAGQRTVSERSTVAYDRRGPRYQSSLAPHWSLRPSGRHDFRFLLFMIRGEWCHRARNRRRTADEVLEHGFTRARRSLRNVEMATRAVAGRTKARVKGPADDRHRPHRRLPRPGRWQG